MARFQTAISKALAYGLGLYTNGGSVTMPTVTAVPTSSSSRRLTWSSPMLAWTRKERVLQTQTGVNAAYVITYITPASGTAGAAAAAVITQLQAVVASGAVTTALNAYGFSAATANSVVINVAPVAAPSAAPAGASPTPAPTVLTQPKLIATVVMSVVGACCCCAGAYYAYGKRSGGGGGGRTWQPPARNNANFDPVGLESRPTTPRGQGQEQGQQGQQGRFNNPRGAIGDDITSI